MGTQKIKCVIISGAPNDDSDYLKNSIDDSSFVIAADSGYKRCLDADITPNLIIGDFDSSSYPDINCEIVHLPVEKDDTDTFYCVKEAVKRGYKEIEIYNAIGDRVDHTYANMLCLHYCLNNNVRAFIKNKKNKIFFVNDKAVLDNNEYQYFSVFSFSEKSEGVTIKDSYYQVDNVTLNNFDQYGESNHFNGKEVTVSVNKGILIVILSND